MFNEDEDWSDGDGAQATIKPVLKESPKTNSITKPKVVGKKSLMRTLQALGSVPEWKNEERMQTSDSEAEARPSPSKKKKKKRKKKRKRAGTSGEQQENGDESAKEEKPAIKKIKTGRKSGASKAESASAKETKDKNVSDSDQLDANQPENLDKLSRQQWKNKMKNRRKCKNKYRQDKPEDGVNTAADTKELKKGVRMDSSSNNCSLKSSEEPAQKKKGKEVKQQRRENTKKQLLIKEDRTKSKVEISLSEIPAVQSKPQTNESKVEITEVDKQNSKLTPEQRKELNLKRQKLRKLLQSQAAEQHNSPAEQRDESAEPEEQQQQQQQAAPSPAESFRSRMEQRLESARFRYINEVLYSTTSGEAKRMFSQDPQAFWVYHKGYTAQVQRWPSNPVDGIIAYIQKQSSSLVVADFGCGDCKIARNVKNKVHSFDLAATCELVTVCDMAHVPLEDGSVDIAVFCLSLMGTNLAEFVAEANRVLKMGGVLKIAEVASRFDNVRNFITALSRLGFKMESKNTENTHFYSFDFEKTGNVPENVKKFGLELKPCLYKKR